MVDDLLVYRVASEEWLVVANASNAERVAALLAERIGTTANVSDESDSTAMIAVQGPRSCDVVAHLFEDEEADAVRALRNYSCCRSEALIGGVRIPLIVARTGYTGEDGFEFYLPAVRAVPLACTPYAWTIRSTCAAADRAWCAGHAPVRSRDATLRQRAA